MRVTVALARAAAGNLSNAMGLGGGVSELRIDFGPGCRIYFGRDGATLIILLAGGTKKRQQRDIEAAQQRWADYERRKRELRPMPLTRSFKDTVQTRAQRDPRFRRALLIEAVEALLAGDLSAGKGVLRDYINATMGFEALAVATGIDAKILMRMLGPSGNPQTANLFVVLDRLQEAEGIALELRPGRRRRVSVG